MKKTVWLSFDLGINGDYEGMYAWLDEHNAKECGDSMALAKIEIAKEGELVPAVKRDLKKSVKLASRSRIYMVYRGEDDSVKGTWLTGSRKQAPWTGYGKSVGEAVTDEA